MIALAFANLNDTDLQDDKKNNFMAEVSKYFIKASVSTLPVLLKFTCVLVGAVIFLILALPKAAGHMITPEFYMVTTGIVIAFLLAFAFIMMLIGVIREMYT